MTVHSLEVQVALLGSKVLQQDQTIANLSEQLVRVQESNNRINTLANRGLGGLAVLLIVGTFVGYLITTSLNVWGRLSGH